MRSELYALYDYRFSWDFEKNLSNIEKHGVSFKEAATVFLDPNATLLDDIDHADDEDRFNVIGLSESLRLLTVCHCYLDGDAAIRIISARRATRSETRLFGGAA